MVLVVLAVPPYFPTVSDRGPNISSVRAGTMPTLAILVCPYHFSSVQWPSHSLQPHGLQHTRLPCPSPTPGACSNSCPSNW